MTNTYTTNLIEGIAQLLADADIGLSWQTSGDYSADETGIFALAVPQSPARLVSLSVTPMKASPTLTAAMFNMQIMSRSATSDPREVMAMDDATQDVLGGNYPLTLPSGVRINTLQYLGGGSLGQDDATPQRWLWASRYQLVAYRPGTHRL